MHTKTDHSVAHQTTVTLETSREADIIAEVDRYIGIGYRLVHNVIKYSDGTWNAVLRKNKRTM